MEAGSTRQSCTPVLAPDDVIFWRMRRYSIQGNTCYQAGIWYREYFNTQAFPLKIVFRRLHDPANQHAIFGLPVSGAVCAEFMDSPAGAQCPAPKSGRPRGGRVAPQRSRLGTRRQHGGRHEGRSTNRHPGPLPQLRFAAFPEFPFGPQPVFQLRPVLPAACFPKRIRQFGDLLVIGRACFHWGELPRGQPKAPLRVGRRAVNVRPVKRFRGECHGIQRVHYTLKRAGTAADSRCPVNSPGTGRQAVSR